MTDPGLSTLSDVFQPATMMEHLARVFPDERGTIEDIGFRILKHHPGKRCTLQIDVRAAGGEYSLIGKVYASDRSDVYHAMQAIRRAGFGPGQQFSIPEPRAYISELHLLLQEKVDGRQAKLIILAAVEGDPADATARAARWLARFHAMAPRSGRVAPLIEHLDSTERWSKAIARLGEPFGAQARRLAAGLEEAASSASTGEGCAGHGSYDCHQIILAPGRTVTVDWDGYDVADPCRDVARFVVALQRLAVKYRGSIHALDAPIHVFLETYQALSPFAVAANLAWYRALTCLRLAKYEANRPVCSFPEGIEALLGEGLHVLGETRHAQAAR